uniref:hypothetical protein n=1 Tax=Agrobacterium radiobacter TaxID=362 RepID=UPI001AEE86A8
MNSTLAPINVEDERWWCHLSSVSLSASLVSRIDRPAWLTKGGLRRPSRRSPHEGRASPSLKHPPMGKGDGSLHPFPKPLSLSRVRPAAGLKLRERDRGL